MNSVEIRRFADDDWPGVWYVWHEVVSAGESYDNAPDSTETNPTLNQRWVAAYNRRMGR